MGAASSGKFGADGDFDLQLKVFRRFRRGADPEAVALRAVCEAKPRDVLDVGAGDGLFAESVRRSSGADVIAVDVSPRMVQRARARGIEAGVADVQALPFADACFDCVVANWMLYLAPDLDRALCEIVRVMRPGGRLVAGTVAEDTFSEVRQLLQISEPPRYSFSAESAAALLDPLFVRVERHDVCGTVVFPTWQDLQEFVALSPERAARIERMPPVPGPFTTTNHLAVFVADKATVSADE